MNRGSDAAACDGQSFEDAFWEKTCLSVKVDFFPLNLSVSKELGLLTDLRTLVDLESSGTLVAFMCLMFFKTALCRAEL